VSLDGVPAAQAARGAWTFAHLDGLLDRLRRDHARWFARHLSVSATVTAANTPHLADSVAYLVSKGVRAIVLAPAMGASGRWSAEASAALAAQFSRVVDLSVAHLRATGRVPLDLFRAPAASFGASLPMCGAAAGTKAAIDVDGQMYSCTPAVPTFGDGAPPLVREASLALRLGHAADARVADALPEFRESVERTGLFGPRRGLHSALGPCSACRWRRSCTVCPMTIAYDPGSGGVARVPDNVCAFNRIALSSRAQFVRRARAAPAAHAAHAGARRDRRHA
jgi:hypothetical protein